MAFVLLDARPLSESVSIGLLRTNFIIFFIRNADVFIDENALNFQNAKSHIYVLGNRTMGSWDAGIYMYWLLDHCPHRCRLIINKTLYIEKQDNFSQTAPDFINENARHFIIWVISKVCDHGEVSSYDCFSEDIHPILQQQYQRYISAEYNKMLRSTV